MPIRLSQFIPNFMRPTLRKTYYRMADKLANLRGRDPLTPPQAISFALGGGDFEQVGQTFKHYFIEFGQLAPQHQVLDIGSGVGRMALPLADYLTPPHGGYTGIDILPDGVAWCQQQITRRYPHLQFQYIDVYNRIYNPKGRIQAHEFRFPFEDATFDFVFLTSVFTHMLPADLENYLGEIARVLKPGGRCLITYFILNDESRALIASGESSLNFQFELQGCLTTDLKNPEVAIAFEENTLREWYGKVGLQIEAPIYYGAWCARANPTSYQDMVVAVKA